MGKILQFPKKNKKQMTKWTPPELPIDLMCMMLVLRYNYLQNNTQNMLVT